MAAFTDAFTGTSGTSLIGRSGWTKLGSGTDAQAPFINASNQLRSASGGSGDAPLVGQDTGSANHYIRFTALSQFPYTGVLRFRVGVRAFDRSGAYWVAYNGTDLLWELFRENTRVGTYATAFVSGTVVYFYANGADIRVELNGVERLGATDTTRTASTRVGILGMSDALLDPVMDDWSSDVGLFSGGDTTVPTLTGVITEVSKTQNSISISYPAGSDNVAVTSYEVSNNAGTSYTDVGNVLAHTFTGLTASTLYALRVRAKDGAGLVSTPALALSVTTLAPDGVVPTFPGGTNLTAGTKTSTSVALTTSAAATDNVAVTGYEWSLDNGTTYPFTSLTNSFTFTALTALTAYNFRVRAYDGAGNRSLSLALTTSTYRAGDTGQNIFDNTGPVGGNPAGAHLNKVVLPGDAAKWFASREITPPATGVLTFNPNGTYTFLGPNYTTTTRQLEVDGVDTPAATPFTISFYNPNVAATQDIAWSVRGSVQTAELLGWAVRNLVSSLVSVAWSFEGVSLVSATQQLAWTVRGYSSVTQLIRWTVDGATFVSAPSGGGFNPLGNNKIRPARFFGKN